MTFVPEESKGFVFWNKTRIYILILTLACLALIQINTLAFNFTVICMNDVVEEHYRSTNCTKTHWFERNTEKSLLFSGAAIGSLIGLIPTVPLISSFGLRNVQTISGIVSACGAFFFPIAVSLGFYASMFCRILQGIGMAIVFTTIGVVPTIWATGSETNTFTAILSSSLQLSNIIFMPVSGILCESSLGWRSIYYIFGGLTFLVFVVFWITYKDDPKLHRNVSQKELSKISAGKVEFVKEPVPYRAICTDPTVLITWVSSFGGHMGLFVLIIYGPTYFREILKFDIAETGYLSALPYILSAIVKCSAGQISDRSTFLSEKTRFVFFASISQIGLAAGLIVMSFTSSRLVAQIAFNCSILSSGFNVMGVIKCVQLRCRQHVHFAMGVISFTVYAGQFLAPILVSLICPDNTAEQWTFLFLSVTGIIIVCSIGFPFITNSNAADYTMKNKIDYENS